MLETLTPDYEHPNLIYGYWLSNNRIPPFWRFRDVEAMLLEPRVDIALSYIKGPVISLSKFFVDEEDASLKEFLIDQINRWWRTSVEKMLTALEWGYSGLEVLYVVKDGVIQFDNTKHFRSPDVRPVTKEGSLCGMTVKQRLNVGGSLADPSADQEIYIGSPKSLLHVYRRERHPWYGQSRLQPAYSAWQEMISEGGARDIRRLYFYKHAFQREKIYHKPGKTPTPNGERWNKDIAREIVENARTGGIYCFPSEYDPVSGNRIWEVEDGGMDGGAAMDVLQYPEELRKEIAEGIGVPTELIEAAETGSGYSGRRVPQDAFRGMLSTIAYWAIHDFNEQVLIPLLRLNYGIVEPTHEIIPFGLIQDENEAEDGSEQVLAEEENQTDGIPEEPRTDFSEDTVKVVTREGFMHLPKSLFKDQLSVAV